MGNNQDELDEEVIKHLTEIGEQLNDYEWEGIMGEGFIRRSMVINVTMPDIELHTGDIIQCIDVKDNCWVFLGNAISGKIENYEAELKNHIDNSLEEIKASFVALAKTRTRLMSIKRVIEEE